MLIIGCPVKNDLESLKEMYFSLINSTTAYDKIVFIIGEGTNQETLDFLQLRENDFIKIVNAQTKTPLEAYNKLFELALEERADLLLTQTDVIFPKLYKRDWLLIMKDIAKNEQLGAITCINGGGVSGPDYIDGFAWLGGWCSYYPLRTIEKVGGYDKDFPNGYGVDIDHTYRIVKAELKIAQINYWVDHHMMNEREHDASPNSQQMMKDSAKYFKEKWKL